MYTIGLNPLPNGNVSIRWDSGLHGKAVTVEIAHSDEATLLSIMSRSKEPAYTEEEAERLRAFRGVVSAIEYQNFKSDIFSSQSSARLLIPETATSFKEFHLGAV